MDSDAKYDREEGMQDATGESTKSAGSGPMAVIVRVDRTVSVMGQAQPFENVFRNLGGVYEEQPQSAWIFPEEHRDQIENILSEANVPFQTTVPDANEEIAAVEEKENDMMDHASEFEYLAENEQSAVQPVIVEPGDEPHEEIVEVSELVVESTERLVTANMGIEESHTVASTTIMEVTGPAQTLMLSAAAAAAVSTLPVPSPMGMLNAPPLLFNNVGYQPMQTNSLAEPAGADAFPAPPTGLSAPAEELVAPATAPSAPSVLASSPDSAAAPAEAVGAGADAGVGSTAATETQQPTGSVTTSTQQQQQQLPEPTIVPFSPRLYALVGNTQTALEGKISALGGRFKKSAKVGGEKLHDAWTFPKRKLDQVQAIIPGVMVAEPVVQERGEAELLHPAMKRPRSSSSSAGGGDGRGGGGKGSRGGAKTGVVSPSSAKATTAVA